MLEGKDVFQRIFNGYFLHFPGTERIHPDGNRSGVANGVSHLQFTFVRQSGSHNVLGNPAAHIRGGTVHLGRVFPGKGSAAVAPHAAVCVHNNFAARQAGIPVGTAHDEFPGGVDEIFRPLIQKLRRKHIFNEFDAI